MAEEPAVAATRFWLHDFVIALNLCPFAAATSAGDRIRFVVSRAARIEDIYREFLVELEAFVPLPPAVAETGLFIVPDGLDDFADYLELLAMADDALDQVGLRGVLQLASFHPEYRFAGAGPDDPANFTNRSPYPMLHLIREAGLAAALENYPNPEGIPERNICTLRDLGLAEIRKRLAGWGGRD